MTEPFNGQALLERQGQTQYLRRVLEREQYQEQAQYYAALRLLAQDGHFDTVLTHWLQTVFLLNEGVTPYDEGQRLFLRRVLKDLREASVLEQVAAQRARSGP